ncbi:ABC transporter permease [Leucobacter insecticola]|uniref:ABC transporter permease n=1 Tax=Leucobacter insecticola TaxID=2714934 RepID=A0A6G8FKE6_9MICO|nr:ABC transporter permease [Leucobacter insecticola]QIM16824.1 ABC transporter permease [Leucobacter insecticola]
MTSIASSRTAASRRQSTWRLVVGRLRRRPDAIVGAVIVAVFLAVALLAPWLTPYSPGSAEWAALVSPTVVPGPSAEHLLGLDSFGSDLATQLLFGARQSLIIGLSATAIGVTLGSALGILAGGIGGPVDAIIMRFVDILLSIPGLLLAVSIAAIMGKSPFAIMIAIGVSQIPIFARLMRGSMLGERGREYVLAARSLGFRTRSIITTQMLPNAIGPVIVQATLVLATATIEVAALSYLGLGTADPTAAEWGRMLVKAQSRLETAPLLAFAPGICIAVTALGFTLLGESLREALDPKGKAQR